MRPDPICDNCRKPMHHMATMPAMGKPGKAVTVYRCEPCDRLKWIEE
jgi:hypothetical protein